MAYFRQLDEKMQSLLSLFRKDEKWLILINADPDALASAMALRRIMARRVEKVGIMHINEISRPDNLAMIQYLRIPTRKFSMHRADKYDRYALVDSQPHHAEEFRRYPFSIVVDHHPKNEKFPVTADYVEIRPDYGSNATIFTEYLYNLKVRPARLLATALLYGIKTDTQSFERKFVDADIKAFRYLTKHADQLIAKRITRSEFRREWLGTFSQAIKSMHMFRHGIFAYMDYVENPDILVILADFFLRVHEINWTIIAGRCNGTLTVIFRGDGLRRDMGAMAANLFADIGSAGGHREAARAEISIEALKGREPQKFIKDRLTARVKGLLAPKK